MKAVLFHLTGVAGSITAMSFGLTGLGIVILILSFMWTVLSIQHDLKQ